MTKSAIKNFFLYKKCKSTIGLHTHNFQLLKWCYIIRLHEKKKIHQVIFRPLFFDREYVTIYMCPFRSDLRCWLDTLKEKIMSSFIVWDICPFSCSYSQNTSFPYLCTIHTFWKIIIFSQDTMTTKNRYLFREQWR